MRRCDTVPETVTFRPTCGRRQFPLDRGVPLVQPSTRGQCLVERAKYHAEDRAEGSVKSTDRIANHLRVLRDRCRHPRMGQLQQQGATSAKENCRLPVNLPDQGIRAEQAFPSTTRARSNELKLIFEIFPPDDLIDACIPCNRTKPVRLSPFPRLGGRQQHPFRNLDRIFGSGFFRSGFLLWHYSRIRNHFRDVDRL
jgi:hypothetical protein